MLAVEMRPSCAAAQCRYEREFVDLAHAPNAFQFIDKSPAPRRHRLPQTLERRSSCLVRPCSRCWSACASAKMRFRSMTNPEARVRLVYPHAVVRAGRRWHARAWCFEREEFRDFAITRAESAAFAPEAPPRAPAAGTPSGDRADRASRADTAPGPAHRLCEPGGQSSRVPKLRSCLVEYVLQDLRVAVDHQRQRPPAYQLAIADTSRIERYLFQGGGGA